ncbi:MAG: S10 family peptidase, partial [Pyrinomonadaceae bacterium]
MLAVLFFCFALVSFGQPDAQRRPPGQQPAATPQTGASPSASPGGPASGQQRGAPERPAPSPEEPPVVTKHEIRVGGRTHRYTATTGMMPIKNRDGETEARLFFMAYTLDDASNRARRPLTFSFNGGPGSSSVWLHLGTVGPKRVRMNSDGGMPAPPFELVDNEHTWLTQSDLVFIDPVGTGYSRSARPDLAAKFLGLQGDIESVGEFIRLYLTRNERWASPLFLVGESYGTTRASALSGYLIDRGIAFNGIMLVSAIMNFQTTAFAPGNDLPYALFLPAYAATAWYHKRLPSDLQSRPLTEVVAEVEDWSLNQYTVALARGDRMSPQQRQEVAA